MPTLHSRTEILLGQETAGELRRCHILVAGIGGVGGYVAENLARAGIGELTLVDKDVISISNINRQLVALHSTIGTKKTAVMKARISDIDPSIRVNVIDSFISVETAEQTVLSGNYDFIADCIDSIACKAQLIFAAQKHHIPIISAMGAGNRVDAGRVRIARLDKTQGCPLAREMRRRLRTLKANLKYPVVYSDEPCRPPCVENIDNNYRGKAINGTISYLPAAVGILLAGEVIKTLISKIDTDNNTRGNAEPEYS